MNQILDIKTRNKKLIKLFKIQFIFSFSLILMLFFYVLKDLKIKGEEKKISNVVNLNAKLVSIFEEANTEKENNAEAEYLDMLNRHIVDGIITGVHSLNVETYEKINKPIVALDRYLGEDIPVVTADHKEGGRLAAELLARNGCRNVLHFTGSTEISSPYLERHFEFERVMRNHGINVFTYQLKLNRFDVEYYREAAKDAFSKSADYDGIFAVDELAVECMNEVIRSKKRVPEDIKIVAYDGTFIADMTEPRLTVIAQPIDSLAKESVRLLRDLMNGKSFKNKQIILDVQIRSGGTTFNS